MKQRIIGLNRRIFKRNLKRVLLPYYSKMINFESYFNVYVTDYSYHVAITGSYGWYEVESFLTKSGHAEEIRTN